jgi:hypothetical protein
VTESFLQLFRNLTDFGPAGLRERHFRDALRRLAGNQT